MPTSILINDQFYANAKSLRADFEKRFDDPHSANADRFIWDYWNVPGQYTALRTPAYHFFKKKLYDDFHQRLVWWGRRTLGCHNVSPPWMSCYVEGCKQEIHGDLPHGPWAFVFSLTPWQKRTFTGGETVLLRDDILSYWRNFDSGRGLEREDATREVPALFNRLTVFDPRIPHGVREVRGAQDVLQGRLVIHGWFVKPRPFIEGPLKTSVLQSAINDLSGDLAKLIEDGLNVSGVLSLQINVSASGNVTRAKTLVSSLRDRAGDNRVEKALIRHIRTFMKRVNFGRQRATSQITLPLIFE